MRGVAYNFFAASIAQILAVIFVRNINIWQAKANISSCPSAKAISTGQRRLRKVPTFPERQGSDLQALRGRFERIE